jgi:hypothetical protein
MMRFLLVCFTALALQVPVKAGKQEFDIPINIGFGPELNYYNGAVGKDQPLHCGIKLDIHAFIDKEVLDKNQNKIPRKWRKQVKKLSSVKISKVYIPESIIISPRIGNTGIYGINFRPLGATGLVSRTAMDFNLGLGINLTYLLIHSDALFAGEESNVMHFLRPGLSAQANLLFKLSRGFQLSTGLEGTAYLPQELSSESTILEIGEFSNESLWCMGQLYFMVNIRIPKKVRL